MLNAPSKTNATDPQQTDSPKLISFREVYSLLGYNCRTGHSARALAARGQIKAVRINDRVIRYSQASVLALIAGKADA